MLQLVEGAETSENLKAVISDGVKRGYGVTFSDLTKKNTFVTDCASTLPCLVGASSSSNKVPLSYKWMGCVSDQLNTCMKKVLGEKYPEREPFQTIRKSLQAAKTIVRIFKQSNVTLSSGLKLVQEVKIRFSTTFLVVERFLRCLREIREEIEKQPVSSPLAIALHDLEFDVAADGAPLLPALNAIYIVCKPLKEMQTAMEAGLKPTLHRLIPMMEYCKDYLLKLSQGNMLMGVVPSMEEADRQISCAGLYFRELGKIMFESLCEIEIHPLWSAGCILHPRLCLMTCVNDPLRRESYMRAGKAEIWRLIALENSEAVNPGSREIPAVAVGSAREERRLAMAARSDIQFSLETALDCPTPNPTSSDELTTYIQSPYQGDVSDIMAKDDLGSLRWWINRRSEYPVLHKVALWVLATPASSGASERDFSMVNNTASATRSRLTSEILDCLCYSKSVIGHGFAF